MRFQQLTIAMILGWCLLTPPAQAQERHTWRVVRDQIAPQPASSHPSRLRMPIRDGEFAEVIETQIPEPPLRNDLGPAPRSELEWIEIERVRPVQYLGPVQYTEDLSNPMIVGPATDEFYWPYQWVGSRSQPCDTLACNQLDCPSTYWLRADYLYWYLDGAGLPPLLTTSSAGTSFSDAGVLGLPTTGILVGNEKVNDQGLSGARFEAGRWFPARGVGFHFAFFGLEDADFSRGFESNSTPIIARPFFSVEPGAIGSNADVVGFPNEVTGTAVVLSRSKFGGGEFMLRRKVADCRERKLQLLAGLQFVGLDDDLAISDFKQVIGGSSGIAIGTTLAGVDVFETENRFGGFSLGVLGSVSRRRWTFDGGVRVALGNNRARVRINGATTATVPLPGGGVNTVTSQGGLLALPTNIGNYEHDVFAVVPELHLGLAYDINPQTRALIGYRFLYWSQVARAADQIDTGVNLSQLDPGGLNGEARPRFDFLLTDFWAQGLNVGLDYRF